MTDPIRRSILGGVAGAALITGASAFSRPAQAAEMASGDAFGLVGDGEADDTDALQKAFDAALAAGADARLVEIPQGRYRVTRPIEVITPDRPEGNITHPAGILAKGATVVSEVGDGQPVVSIDIRATLRFTRIEGLHIAGSGSDGAGMRISCQTRGTYFYNFCVRDCVIESCGGNGCEMIGNIFEGQIFNSYFRDNGRDGAVFAHGAEGTVFSAVHVFGAVFGGNHRNGVSMEDGTTDVSFHGCYFLLNGRFGLSAGHAVTLLSHCGFENNHQRASSFSDGDAGLRLMVGGTLVGCTAYSVYKQKYLVRAYITNRLTMIGCTGAGDGDADSAGLAKLGGTDSASFTLIGCYGRTDEDTKVELTEFGSGEGVRVGENWDSSNILSMGAYRLWIDGDGKLRVVKGKPESDTDGSVVGG